MTGKNLFFFFFLSFRFHEQHILTINFNSISTSWYLVLSATLKVIFNECKVPFAIYGQRRPRSDCANAQSDQGLNCPLTGFNIYTRYSIHYKIKLERKNAHAQAGLSRQCSHIAQGILSHIWASNNFVLIGEVASCIEVGIIAIGSHRY